MHGECQNEQRLRFEIFPASKSFQGTKNLEIHPLDIVIEKEKPCHGDECHHTALKCSSHACGDVGPLTHTDSLGEHRRFLHLAMRCRTAQRQHRVMETVSGGERQYVRLQPATDGRRQHKTCTQTQISKHHSPQTRARFERRTMSMWWNLIFCPFACQECTHLNAGQQQEWGLGGWPSIHGVYEI